MKTEVNLSLSKQGMWTEFAVETGYIILFYYYFSKHVLNDIEESTRFCDVITQTPQAAQTLYLLVVKSA